MIVFFSYTHTCEHLFYRRDGKITRNELCRILDCFLFQINDEELQDLIKLIDPEHTGHLSYHKFLDLFEEKESLVSDHQYSSKTMLFYKGYSKVSRHFQVKPFAAFF